MLSPTITLNQSLDYRLQTAIANLNADAKLTPIAPPLALLEPTWLCMASKSLKGWMELRATALLLGKTKPLVRRGKTACLRRAPSRALRTLKAYSPIAAN